MPYPIRIMLIDDHYLARESWKMLLNNDKRFEVIYDCDNGRDAIEQVEFLLPDIILVDINMYPMNGFEITKEVLAAHPAMKLIGLSVTIHSSYAGKIIAAGGKGYVTKSSSFDEITRAIEEVYKGNTYICGEIKNIPPDF